MAAGGEVKSVYWSENLTPALNYWIIFASLVLGPLTPIFQVSVYVCICMSTIAFRFTMSWRVNSIGDGATIIHRNGSSFRGDQYIVYATPSACRTTHDQRLFLLFLLFLHLPICFSFIVNYNFYWWLNVGKKNLGTISRSEKSTSRCTQGGLI